MPDLGLNIGPLGPGDTLRLCADAAKSAVFYAVGFNEYGQPRPVPSSNGAVLAKLGPDGWPVERFLMGITESAAARGIAGDYRLSKAGPGNPKPAGCNATLTGDLLTCPADASGITLYFDAPAKDIRLIRPGCKPTDLLNPAAVDLLRPFKGGLRWMDYGYVNHAVSTGWDDRTKLTDATWTGLRGGPIEVAVETCNRTGNPLWLNVPARWQQADYEALADYLAGALDPALSVDAEYSNECGNWGDKDSTFLTYSILYTEAQETRDPRLLEEPDVGNRVWMVQADETVKIVQALRNRLGAHRVRGVLTQLLAHPDWLETALAFIRRHYGPPRDYLHAVASAPYYVALAA
jgi:hypothetical protein